MLARNSEALTVLLAIAADSRVSLKTVEIAGRGISAYVRSTLWVLNVGKKSLNGLVLADLLIEKGELVEAIAAAWRSFDSGEIAKVDFEVHLSSLVKELEGWGGAYM